MSRPTPDPRSAYRHFRAISTRWMDNDVYGHVNNVVYYSYFDTVVNQYLMDEGVLDVERGAGDRPGRRNALQLFQPDHVSRTRCTPACGWRGWVRAACGTRSGCSATTSALASAQGHFVHVYVDRFSRRPAALPDELRTALSALRAG